MITTLTTVVGILFLDLLFRDYLISVKTLIYFMCQTMSYSFILKLALINSHFYGDNRMIPLMERIAWMIRTKVNFSMAYHIDLDLL